jgi:glycine/D-amino acid oxidase-like deaminating enzyme
MPIAIDRIATSGDLPERADVVVIGGGVIGVAAALYLAERGVSVALCEKGFVAHEQSGRNWGWVRVMGRDPGEIPMVLESQRLWENMGKLVQGDVGFSRSGIVYTSDTPEQLAAQEQWMEHARPYQVSSRMLSPQEIADVLPGVSRRFAGALFTPADARAEPQKAVPAMARALIRMGGHVVEQCAVRGIETSAGRVSGVVTEKGVIRCGQAVLAGGAWSRLFLGNLGIDFPQQMLLGSVFATAPLDGPPTHAVGGSDFAFRKRADGGYTVARRNASIAEITPDSFRLFLDFAPAMVRQRHELRIRIGKRFLEEARMKRRWRLDEATPFEAVRVLDPAPHQGLVDEGFRNLKAAFPAFGQARIAFAWGGMVDATPDAVPVIGEVPRIPGFFIASGFSGHGFGIGPGAGKITADLVMGRRPAVDTTPFRLERFGRLARTTAN